MSVVLAFLFACVPLLPAEHMHRAGIEGRDRPLVHSHPLAAGGLQTAQPDSALVASHGNHDLAVFLSTVYDHSPRFSSQAPLPAGARADIAPVFRPIGPATLRSHHRTHGPPRSVWLTRGPPSLG